MSDPFTAAPAGRNSRPASDVERDRWDRPLLPDIPAGDPYGPTDPRTKSAYTSVSTLAAVPCDFYGLHRWQTLKAVVGIATREDLYELACSLDPNDPNEKKDLYRLCDDAQEAAGSTVGANRGKAIHKFTERINVGEDPGNVPKSLRADVDAYVNGLAEWQYKPMSEYAEKMIVVPGIKAAGTVDVPLACPRWPLPRIGDTKSAQELDHSAMQIAIQLAIYSRAAALWNPKTRRYEPWPKVDQRWGVVLGVPAGQGRLTVHRVDLDRGWQLALAAFKLHQDRKYKGYLTELTPAEDVADDATPAGFSWAEQIEQAPDGVRLRAIRAAAQEAGEWTAELNALGLKRIEKILAARPCAVDD